jgi:hypothetical protein
MSNFNIGALRQLPPATFFADFRNGYTNEMVRLNTTRSTTVSTRVNNSGLIETVGANIPRLDYDPVTKAVKGLLVEPAAENKCVQSEDFSTTWFAVSGNATVAANATTAPDGTTTADELRANTTLQAYSVQQGFTTPSADHTFSVFAKKDELNYIQLYFGNTTQQYANFDLDLGVVGTKGTAAASSTIEDYGNGWYRCSVHINVGTIPSFGISIVPSASATWQAAVSAGSSSEGIFIWGAQLETGPIATSYIPTASAAVTRVKDDITQTGAQSLIGQTEGTLYLEVDWKTTSGQFQFLLDVTDGTNANRMLIYNTNGGELKMFAAAGGPTLISQGESSSAYSGIQKIAFAYKTDDFELYRNGSSISSQTSGSFEFLDTLTDIDLGQQYNTTFQANMHIRAVALYPTRLGAVELEVLTGAPTYGSYALMASSLGYTVE